LFYLDIAKDLDPLSLMNGAHGDGPAENLAFNCL